MDAVGEERGQAVFIAILAIGLAAAGIAGLIGTQQRLLLAEQRTRAGEAAVAAAAAAVADVYAAERAGGAERRAGVVAALSADGVREAALAAANALSVPNGGTSVDDVRVRCENGAIEVTIVARGRHYRAGFEAPECFPR